MPTEKEKITITNNLKNDIVMRRKNMGLTSYSLSEASHHSQYWLPNIESGKIKKITISDLLSIYKVLFVKDEAMKDDDIINYIEKMIHQQIGGEKREWYELINISDEFSKNLDSQELMSEMQKLTSRLSELILKHSFYNFDVTKLQAALTALYNLYFSFRINPELTLALINIPVYGVNEEDGEEYQSALKDIMAMGTKFNDLAMKNNSQDDINRLTEQENLLRAQRIGIAHNAYDSLNSMVSLIADLSNTENPPLKNILDTFYKSVCMPIDQLQPETIGNELPAEGSILTGQSFQKLIGDCYDWFERNQDRYNLIEEVNTDQIDYITAATARKFLDNYGNITS